MKFLISLLIISGIVILIKRTSFISAWASICFHRGENEKAIKVFAFADKIGTVSPQNLFSYGYILLRVGNTPKAREVLTRASLSTSKPLLKQQIKGILALVEWKENNISLAIEMLEDAISEFKITTFYQNLGLLYVINGDKEKALEFNLEAYEYNSEDMIIMDNLAESYALCGDFEKAKEVYEKLLELEPHFPEAYYGYGLVLIKMGEKERGIEFIRQSLDKRFSFLSVKSHEEVEEMLNNIISGV